MKITRIGLIALIATALMGGAHCAKPKAVSKPKVAPKAVVKAKPPVRKPILSCDAYSLRDYMGRKELTYMTLPKFLKDIGIHGVAFNDAWMESWDNAYLDKLKQVCADAGVKITALICGGNMATTNEEAWEAQIKENEARLRTAAYLGAPAVRFNIGGLGSDELDSTVGIRRCAAAFNRLVPLAKELNVKMTIENHGGVSKKADWILAVIKGSDPQWVGACLDFGNWPDAERNSESAKLARYCYHTHAKCHKFTPDGEDTNKDYKYLLGLLKEARYSYAVSIEYEGPDDQKMGVEKSRDLILKYWPELAKP